MAKENMEKESLITPIQRLKGVPTNLYEPLERLEIRRAVDLLFFFPRSYQECLFRRGDELVEDELQTILGTVETYNIVRTRRGTMISLDVQAQGETVQSLWFNLPYLLSKFYYGQRLFLTGKPVFKKGFWQFVHPRIVYVPDEPAFVGKTDDELADFFLKKPGLNVAESSSSQRSAGGSDCVETVSAFKDSAFKDSTTLFPLEKMPITSEIPEGEASSDVLLPVYPLTEGIRQLQLHRLIRKYWTAFSRELPEVFPPDYLAQHQLLPIAEAIRRIHFPKNQEEVDSGRRRFIFQELFILQLALAIRRQQHHVNLKAPVLERTAKIDRRIRSLIPFDLTSFQNEVIEEIAADMSKPVPMNRLLQGDVGSGKTLVAVYAMLQCVANGYQAIFMAPTEVLARQHQRTLKRLLADTHVQIATLMGGQKAAERQAVLQAIESGTAQIVVGTQALVCNDLAFHRLGLVVIDEQHRFGVRQRAALKSGTAFDPHYLVMTATPIPRSVTMTLFGDLEVSLLKGMPPGRQPVNTSVADESRRAAWWAFFRQKIQTGRQGYVVVSRVEESEQEELRSLECVYEELSNGELSGFRLAMIHGRMSSEEKEEIMLRFRSGEIQVLVSTSVIEVGVDVPNATLMTIENAERFGLAQLHQLRGRIGRGKYPGFCCAFFTEKSEESMAAPLQPNENEGENEGPDRRQVSQNSDSCRQGELPVWNSLSEEPSQQRIEQRRDLPNVGVNPSQKTLKGKRSASSKIPRDKKTCDQLKKQRETEQKAQLKRREEAIERLTCFAETNDGFLLAEKDLELRGPGELFGTQQHGLPPFRIADLIRDRDVLLEAKKEAQALVQSDPGLSRPEHERLRKQMLVRYGRVLDLGDVG